MAAREPAAAPPLTPEAFAALIAPLGPFTQAHIAVATSGGPDSLALCRLAHAWARAQGHRITALTVDHGLRPGSTREARQTGRWLSSHGIAHHVLRWRGAKPEHGIQAAARDARYRLLLDWCRAHGAVHLLLGHQREDQAETVLMRLAQGSGGDGLAAMARVSERAGVRLLRPCLGVPRARLVATLVALGQQWLDDPSNVDIAHARVRMRRAMATLRAAGITAPRLAAAARRAGGARAELEEATCALLGRAAALYPSGYCLLDPAGFAAAPAAIARRALARILMCVGGAPYPPRGHRLERLFAALRGGSLGGGRTLLGCRVVPIRGALLFCREARSTARAIAIAPGEEVLWDGRFVVRARASGAVAAPARPILIVRTLGREGWAEIAGAATGARSLLVPAPARATLPALWRGRRVAAVPPLDYRAEDLLGDYGAISAHFRPAQALGPAPFSVV